MWLAMCLVILWGKCWGKLCIWQQAVKSLNLKSYSILLSSCKKKNPDNVWMQILTGDSHKLDASVRRNLDTLTKYCHVT